MCKARTITVQVESQGRLGHSGHGVLLSRLAGQGRAPMGMRTRDISRKTIELTYRSRLGCQVFLTKSVDGMIAKLPSATRNMYVDGEYLPVRLIVWSRY
jgi:hypothetical protein